MILGWITYRSILKRWAVGSARRIRRTYSRLPKTTHRILFAIALCNLPLAFFAREIDAQVLKWRGNRLTASQKDSSERFVRCESTLPTNLGGKRARERVCSATPLRRALPADLAEIARFCRRILAGKVSGARLNSTCASRRRSAMIDPEAMACFGEIKYCGRALDSATPMID